MNLTSKQFEEKINRKYLGFCIRGSLRILSQDENTATVEFRSSTGKRIIAIARQRGKTIRIDWDE